MKRTFVKTWIVVGLAAGLFAYIFLVERKKPASDEKPKEKVFSFDKAKVKELSLTRLDGETIDLVKQDAGWRLTSPQAAPADASEADSLLSSVESLELSEVVTENPSDLAEFGLAQPGHTVALRLENAAEPMKLLLGDKTPDGASLYAMVSTRPRVFTIPAYLESSFEKKPFDLRDRDLLHVKRDSVKRLDVSGPEGDYALARDDAGQWSFVAPLETPAGRWSVDGLLGNLENLRMESVAAEQATDLARFGLAKPSRRVALSLSDGQTRTLEIGRAAPASEPSPSPGPAAPSSPAATPARYYAREAGSSLVAVIPQTLVDELSKGMSELRAKRLLDVATYEVESIEIEAGGAKKVFARSTSKDKDGVDVYHWKRTSPDAKDLDTNKVQDALFEVGGVDVTRFVDAPQAPASYGLDAPKMRVKLGYGTKKPEAWFEVGVKDGAYYARRAADTAVLELDAAKAAEMVKRFEEM